MRQNVICTRDADAVRRRSAGFWLSLRCLRPQESEGLASADAGKKRRVKRKERFQSSGVVHVLQGLDPTVNLQLL